MFVTVVVPSYNRLPLLKRTLDSVSSQTHTEWECLVCDDGSTDGTHECVRELSMRDSRFRLSLGERYGLPAGPRNRGIAEARGDWIAFVDDDDLWHPSKLERQLAAARGSTVDAVATGLVMFNDGCAPDWDAHAAASPVSDLTLEGILRMETPFPSTPTNIIRRARLLSVQGFSEHPAYRALEDYDLWCRLRALPGFQWRIIGGRPLAAARVDGGDSISSWRRLPAPDFVRQRWAMLEIFARVFSANRTVLDALVHPLLRSLTNLADGSAHRSQLLGWRGASIAAYRLAARFALANGDHRGAVTRLVRAVRFGMLARATEPAPLPETVEVLQKRVVRYARAIVRGTTLREDPLPIAPSGAWSSLRGST